MSTQNSNLEQVVVYFDVNCDFCKKSLVFTQNILSIKFQTLDLAELNLDNINGKTIAEANRFDAMIVWDCYKNYYYIGYEGFRFLYSNYLRNKMFRLMIKMIMPVLNFLGPSIYRFVARNRRVAGCSSVSCNMHPKRNEI